MFTTRACNASTAKEEKHLLLERVSAFHFADENYRRDPWHPLNNDPSVILKELEFELGRASSEILGDLETALAVVRADAEFARFFPQSIRENHSVACATLASGHPCALEHVSDTWRGDKSFMLAALKKLPECLHTASDQLRNDREVVLAAVQEEGRSLSSASKELRNDKEVVLCAVKENGEALKYASDELRACQEIVLAAVKSYGATRVAGSHDENLTILWNSRRGGSAFQFAPDEVRGNKDFVLKIVKGHWAALINASPELRADQDIVRAAISQFGGALWMANYSFRADRDIVLQAVTQFPTCLGWVSDDLRADKDFVLLAARCSRDPQTCHSTASEDMQSAVPLQRFLTAYASKLQIPGQQAPIVSISTTQSKDDKDDRNNKILVEGRLLSGAQVLFELPHQERGRHTLMDFAKKLVAELTKQTRVVAPHVFINFETCGENVPVSVWDSGRPLSDFL